MDGYLDTDLLGDGKPSYITQVAMMSLNLPEQDDFVAVYNEPADLKTSKNRRETRSFFSAEIGSTELCSNSLIENEISETATNSKQDSTDKSVSKSILGSKRKIRKNNREKRRRLELNDKFEVLTDMLNMSCAKAEKFVILSEAISLIQSLRMENNSIQHEKIKLRAELQQMTAMLQQTFPGSALPDIQPPVTTELSFSEIADEMNFVNPGPRTQQMLPTFDNEPPLNFHSLSLLVPGSNCMIGNFIPQNSSTNNSSAGSDAHFDIFV